MSRDLGYDWMRLCIYIALAAALGTMFSYIGTDYRSIWGRGSLMVFVATFLAFMAIGGFPSFVEETKVFERERVNEHYGVNVFVNGNRISALSFLHWWQDGGGKLDDDCGQYGTQFSDGNHNRCKGSSSNDSGRPVLDLPKPVLKYPLYHIIFHKYAYQRLFKNDLKA